MVYKKYIKRNGKLYGPYIYHSRRVGGKVISEYRGTGRKVEYKKFIFIFLGVLLISGLIYGITSNKTRLTGNVVMDLEEETRPSITGLIVIPIYEGNESLQGYNLDLGVFYESNLTLNYNWKIDCGYFFKDNESLGGTYSGLDNIIEWYIVEECMDAVVRVDVLVNDNGQELMQSVFNPEDRMIINISAVLPFEDIETVSEKIIEDNEIEIDVIVQEIIPEVTEIIEEIPEIVYEESYFLTENEKQILIEEFGNVDIVSNVKSFNDRIIVRYELGNMWIENSYDADLVDEELEKQMEIDRVEWLKDIINRILSEESVEQELEGFEEGYPI